jgi:hypothetical protein
LNFTILEFEILEKQGGLAYAASRNPERIRTIDLLRGKKFWHFIFGKNGREVSDFRD